MNNTLLTPLITIFSIADNININDNNTHTWNKYNPNSDNNNIPLQTVSQIHNSPYTIIKRKPTISPWRWCINTKTSRSNFNINFMLLISAYVGIVTTLEIEKII